MSRNLTLLTKLGKGNKEKVFSSEKITEQSGLSRHELISVED